MPHVGAYQMLLLLPSELLAHVSAFVDLQTIHRLNRTCKTTSTVTNALLRRALRLRESIVENDKVAQQRAMGRVSHCGTCGVEHDSRFELQRVCKFPLCCRTTLVAPAQPVFRHGNRMWLTASRQIVLDLQGEDVMKNETLVGYDGRYMLAWRYEDDDEWRVSNAWHAGGVLVTCKVATSDKQVQVRVRARVGLCCCGLPERCECEWTPWSEPSVATYALTVEEAFRVNQTRLL